MDEGSPHILREEFPTVYDYNTVSLQNKLRYYTSISKLDSLSDIDGE